jgi:hypothetical protein
MTPCVCGRCLPDGAQRMLYFYGDRITLDPVADAELVYHGGWIVPALVDVHTPGAARRATAGEPSAADSHRFAYRTVSAAIATCRSSNARGSPRWANAGTAFGRSPGG